MSFPKYKYLLTYRYAEIICDLGVTFSRKFYLSALSNLSDIPVRRTVEQFTQALRSGKHPDRTLTCSQGLHPCLARARQRGNKGNRFAWPKTDPRIADFREIGYQFSNLSNLSPLGNLSKLPILPESPENAANFLLTLLHIETFLLSKQVKSAENKFLTEGGYTEKLYNKRIEFRRAEQLKKLKST